MISQRRPVEGGKALEIKMMEILDGMEELSTMVGFGTGPNSFEILSIEPPQTPLPRPSKAKVVRLPQRREISPPEWMAAVG